MNSFPLFDQSLILQQQLLLQQMLIYNQLLVQKSQMLFKPQSKAEQVKTIDENDSQPNSIPVSSKLDETNQIQPLKKNSLTNKDKKQHKKTIKKITKQENHIDEPQKKKKIFLSMLDIKQATYKKFKIIEEQIDKQPCQTIQQQN